jgi:hypothetical protein
MFGIGSMVGGLAAAFGMGKPSAEQKDKAKTALRAKKKKPSLNGGGVLGRGSVGRGHGGSGRGVLGG